MSQQSHDEQTARLMSVAVDWRRVITGVLIGIPIAAATYVGSQRVTEYAMAEINRRLEVQRTTMREDAARFEARVQRDIDALRADVRELRAEQKHQERRR